MQPPYWQTAAAEAGLEEKFSGEALHFLLRKSTLIKVAEDLYFHSTALAEAQKRLAGHFSQTREVTVGEARGLFNTSRKYALPLLEYFDREKITRRVGDTRIPGLKISTEN